MFLLSEVSKCLTTIFQVTFNRPSSLGPCKNDFGVLCERSLLHGRSLIRCVVLDCSVRQELRDIRSKWRYSELFFLSLEEISRALLLQNLRSSFILLGYDTVYSKFYVLREIWHLSLMSYVSHYVKICRFIVFRESCEHFWDIKKNLRLQKRNDLILTKDSRSLSLSPSFTSPHSMNQSFPYFLVTQGQTSSSFIHHDRYWDRLYFDFIFTTCQRDEVKFYFSTSYIPLLCLTMMNIKFSLRCSMIQLRCSMFFFYVFCRNTYSPIHCSLSRINRSKRRPDDERSSLRDYLDYSVVTFRLLRESWSTSILTPASKSQNRWFLDTRVAEWKWRRIRGRYRRRRERLTRWITTLLRRTRPFY